MFPGMGHPPSPWATCATALPPSDVGVIPGRDLGLTSPTDGGSPLDPQWLPGRQGWQNMKQILGHFCTPPMFLLPGCTRQPGGQEPCFCGHMILWPHSLAVQPAGAVSDEGAVQPGNGRVFSEGQPLLPHFRVIHHMPGA